MSTNESSSSKNNLNSSEEKFLKGTTTLDVTIVPEKCPANEGTVGSYFKLTYGKPDKTIIRRDLIKHTKYAKKFKKCKHREDKKNRGDKKKIKKRCALATFIQITDVHIIDATSPARASFLSIFAQQVPALDDAFRPYEAFSTQVQECMVRKINEITKGPNLGQKVSFVISTGDLADGQQINELQNFINNLDGTKIIPNPASPCHYVGIQDDFPSIVYEKYYHPNPPPIGKSEDMFKVQYGYPQYPNILNVASRPFRATGLGIPWYNISGNHDITKLGNYALGFYKMRTLFNQLAIGELPDGLGSKLIEAMTPLQAEAFIKALQLQDADAVLNIIKTSNLREIPKSSKRLQFTNADFVRMHFNTTICPGPVGHGFTQENIENNTLYYTFEISDKITGIALDSCNPNGNLEDPSLAPNGSLGLWQVAWLEKELRKRHSSYYNDENQLVCTNNKDKLILLFSHHTLETMNNIATTATTFDNDPERISGDRLIPILHRYPNILALIDGHTHRNTINAWPDPLGLTQGFWQINTASHIDYPQQSRIIEIAENSDNTISIFTPLINHLSVPNAKRGCFPAGVNQNCSSCCSDNSSQTPNNSSDASSICKEEYTIEEIASISRELSYNNFLLVDQATEGRNRTGTRLDRNTELLLFNPLKRCNKC